MLSRVLFVLLAFYGNFVHHKTWCWRQRIEIEQLRRP